MSAFQKIFSLLLALIVLVTLISLSVLVANQYQYTLIYDSSGQLQRVIQDPGVQIKWPWPLQQVRRLDRRTLMSAGNTGAQPVVNNQKQHLPLAWYVQWRITNPQKYIQHVGDTIDAGKLRLNETLRAALQTQLNSIEQEPLPTLMRNNFSQALKERLNAAVQYSDASWGIEVLDVRITRVDMDQQAADSVQTRMRVTLEQVAAEMEAEAAKMETATRAETDSKRATLMAEGRQQAQKIRGEGDAEAIRIYAQDYAKDPQFASFFRSLAVYRKSFDGKNDILVLDPAKNSFFQRLLKGDGAQPPMRPLSR